jgi:hypothetical protein
MGDNKAKTKIALIVLCSILLFLIPLFTSCAKRKERFAVSFLKSEQAFIPTLTIQVGLGDLDGDGDLDAVYANHSIHHSKVLFNDGTGHFSDSGQNLTQYGHGVGIGDIDGDGDLDILITCAGARDENRVFQRRPSKIYLNNGRGYFEDSGQDLGDTELSGNGIQLIDIDRDGDLDAHIYYYQESTNPFFHHIYLNDGKGALAISSEIRLPDGAKLYWKDLNGDNNLDVFAIVWDEGLRAYLNDGHLTFRQCWEYRDKTFRYGDATLADFDSDGDADVVYARRDGKKDDSILMFLNNGLGQFEMHPQRYEPVKLPELQNCDWNNDGAIDVCIEQYRGDTLIWLNRGDGIFLDFGLRLAEECVAVGDLDGDGDQDIIGKNTVWFNQWIR